MTNQRNPQPNLAEYEDLTRFADENFDTDEVDLFQFSGNSETSPLTKLKSVILSLEWEITDEYLQELAEELAALAPSLQDDKVANLYLQGMGKIGKYLRLRGAHAHANAIKLLLRYFYDFESILNSPDMDNERINRVVQNDLRMFRVLQYQIQLAEEIANEAEGPAGMTKDVVRDTGKASNALRSFKAAVLELDWEVNDSSLRFFADALKSLGEEEIQNKSALILIQGMQALGQYISEERAHAHPEVFNLLHAFHDGLERILDTGPSALDQKQKKRILVDRINRLNHLKKLIAPQDSEVPEAVSMAQAMAEAQARGPATPAPEEPAAPAPALSDAPVPEAPAEEPELFTEVTPALSDAEAPAAPAAPIPGVIGPDDDYDDDEPARFGPVTPALSDVPAPEKPAEEPAFFDDVTPALADAADAPAPAAPATSIPGVIGPDDDYDDDEPAHFGPVAPALSDAPADEAALFDDITPALADEEPGPVAGFSESEMETKQPPTSSADIAAEIDDLFAPDAKQAPAGHDDIAPALAGDDVEPALSFAEEAAQAGDTDLDMELDAFFGESTAPPPSPEAPAPASAAPVAAPVPAAQAPDIPVTAPAGGDEDDELDLFPPTSQTDDLPSALADADVPHEELGLDAEDAELSAKLDSFFDFPSAPAPAPAETPVAHTGEPEETLTLEGDIFADEPAGPVVLEADPTDNAPFFDETPAAPALEEEDEETLLFLDEPAPAQPALLDEETAAPAGDIFSFDEKPAAPAGDALADESASALTDAEPEEEGLILEADEELTAHLDSFFDMPGEPTPAAPAAPVQEPAAPAAFAETASTDDTLLFEEEPVAPAQATEEALSLDDDLFAAEPEPAEALHDETPAALADAEMPEEDALTLEADDELTAHLDSFFDMPGEPAPAASTAPVEEPVAPAVADVAPAHDMLLYEEESAAPARDDTVPFTDEPAAPTAFSEAAPADDTLLFEEEPAVLAQDGTALFTEEPVAPAAVAETPTEDDALLFEEEPAAPARDDTVPFADESAAPAAFSEAVPADDTLLFEEEPAVPAQDDTALFTEEPAAPAAVVETPTVDNALLFEDEHAAPAAVAESPAEADALTLDAPEVETGDMLFADEPGAPALAEESPAEDAFLTLDESALHEEAGTVLFADAPADEAPAEEPEAVEQPKVFEDVVAALADVEPAKGKARAAAEADAGFQDQLDSFFDEPQSVQETPPVEEPSIILDDAPATVEVEETVAAVGEDSTGDAALFAESPEEPAAPADGDGDTQLFEEREEEPVADASVAAPPTIAAASEESPSDMLTLDDALFAPAEEEEQPAPPAAHETLRLDKTASPSDFDDLVDPEEFHDFMMKDGDIDDISDEELALSEEDATPVRQEPEAPAVEAALAGAFDEPAPVTEPKPLFGDEEKGTLAAMDDLFGRQDESTFAESPAPPGAVEDTVSVEEVVADERVFFAEEAPVVVAPAADMAALTASLLGLIAGYSSGQLADCRRQLEDVRKDGGLSPVQTAAASMLGSVLAGMPDAAQQTDAATASLVEGLCTALTEPKNQLPIETVTDYSAWVHEHVSGKRQAQVAPEPEAENATHALHRELTEFRSRMEQELAQLREEIRKR